MTRSNTASLVVAGLLCLALLARQSMAADMTLRSVVLTLGGVGLFVYEATGTDTDATLTVRRADVDDVLKSMVALGGPAVKSVVLPGPDASAAAFAALPIARTALGDPKALLDGLRGVLVDVKDASGLEVMAGRVLGAATTREPAVGTKEGLPRTRVTLLTEHGLRQFVLEDVGAVQVADTALQARIDAALAAVRGQAADERRDLHLRLAAGDGEKLRLGLVLNAPLWKASYRLTLRDSSSGAGHGDATGRTPTLAHLQGWAVVENTTAADWRGVHISLQSGNPVTFRQALYTPAFVARPDVPVDTQTRLLPPPDSRAVPQITTTEPRPASAKRGMAMLAAPAMPAESAPPPPAQIVEALAAARFDLSDPVDLPAGQTASLLFLDTELPAESIDLLSDAATHPLAAVRLTAEGGTSLPAGAVATFGPVGFAGDARLPATPKRETRLLTFAEDNAVAASWDQRQTETVEAVSVAGGVARLTRRERQVRNIHLAGAADATRTILVEISREPDTTLSVVGAVVAEHTERAWRLRLTLPAGQSQDVTATIDHPVQEEVSLVDDPAAVLRLLGVSSLSPAARAALQRVADLRVEATSRQVAQDRLSAQRSALETNETRLRANIAAVPAGDPLHSRLLHDLAADEDHLGALQAALAEAQAAAQAAQDALAAAISSLNLP